MDGEPGWVNTEHGPDWPEKAQQLWSFVSVDPAEGFTGGDLLHSAVQCCDGSLPFVAIISSAICLQMVPDKSATASYLRYKVEISLLVIVTM